MENSLKLTDVYYGAPCKILVRETSNFSQEQEINLRKQYPDYEIKEIGYESETGYKYKYAAFDKRQFSLTAPMEGI